MKHDRTVRLHRTPEQREEILRDYRESQLSQKEFAAQTGISVSTLSGWLKKAKALHKPNSGFVALPNLLPAVPSAAAYRLQWPGGFCLEVGPGFAAPELAALLELLPPL